MYCPIPVIYRLSNLFNHQIAFLCAFITDYDNFYQQWLTFIVCFKVFFNKSPETVLTHLRVINTLKQTEIDLKDLKNDDCIDRAF